MIGFQIDVVMLGRNELINEVHLWVDPNDPPFLIAPLCRCSSQCGKQFGFSRMGQLQALQASIAVDSLQLADPTLT